MAKKQDQKAKRAIGSYNEPRIQMLDGFNEGWIRFEEDGNQTSKGIVTLETVLRELIARKN